MGSHFNSDSPCSNFKNADDCVKCTSTARELLKADLLEGDRAWLQEFFRQIRDGGEITEFQKRRLAELTNRYHPGEE